MASKPGGSGSDHLSGIDIGCVHGQLADKTLVEKSVGDGQEDGGAKSLYEDDKRGCNRNERLVESRLDGKQALRKESQSMSYIAVTNLLGWDWA